MYDVGYPKPVLCNNLEEGKGPMHAYGRFILIYDKNRHNIVKKFSFN